MHGGRRYEQRLVECGDSNPELHLLAEKHTWRGILAFDVDTAFLRDAVAFESDALDFAGKRLFPRQPSGVHYPLFITAYFTIFAPQIINIKLSNFIYGYS